MANDQRDKLRSLPSVHEIVTELELDRTLDAYSNEAITWAVRKSLEQARQVIIQAQENIWNRPAIDFNQALKLWLGDAVLRFLQGSDNSLRRVINATGVVLHTNCGRAILAQEAAEYAAGQAACYSNLELDLETGRRGSRYSHIEKLLTELTGAEAALVVNNNAAAVLLIMNTFANRREVIVSRGELVEVGGSFRIPEVLKAGGVTLIEVGATNRTWLKDYREAVSSATACFLKVHTSNYRIEGFHHSVPIQDLVQLGHELNIPVIEDLGSGSFIDGTAYGLPKEPTIQETVKAGVSIVTFSGDKLLGGPQAGIMVGKKDLIRQLKANQLTRALRVDKFTLAALVGTLRLYQREESHKIPVWNMLSKKLAELRESAERIYKMTADLATLQAEIQNNFSCVGGGAFPTAKLPSVVCAIKPKTDSPIKLEKFLRLGKVAILARIEKDQIIFDPRTLLPEDYQEIALRFQEWEKNNV